MKKTRSLLLTGASVALAAVLALGGTLAYFTDRDAKTNVFTVGNVDIELNEVFEQESELIPGVDIEKKPTITNIGKNDAWVWATIAIPSALDNDDASKNVVHFNFSKESVAEGNWDWGNYNYVQQNIDGVDYNVYTILHESVLSPNKTTLPVMTKVYLDYHIDIDPDGQMYHVLDGEVEKIEWNVNENGNPKILVAAYAIQAQEFATVEAAYAAYQTQWGDKGGVEYPSAQQRSADEYVNIPADAVAVSNLEELVAAFANGGNYEITAPFEVTTGNYSVSATTNLYNDDPANVLSFAQNARIKTAENVDLALYGIKINGGGSFTMENGAFSTDAAVSNNDAMLMAYAGSTLTLGKGTVIEDVVSNCPAVAWAKGTVDNRATIIFDGVTVQNCAGGSGTVINVDNYGDVYIEEGTVISNNVSYNNSNHGIIRIYNPWDATNVSTLTMNGGEISNNYYSGNGLIGLYYAKMTMNDGKIVNNSWYVNNEKHNGFYPVVYVHSNSQFEMNGGEISGNTVRFGVLNCLNSKIEPAIIINGGVVTNNTNTDNNTDAFAALVIVDNGKTYKSVTVSEDATVSGMVWDYYTKYHTLDDYFAQVN